MGSKTSKTTQTNSPPSWAAPSFQTAGAQTQNLYNSGAGGHTYLGSTVAPLSNTTMSGVNQLAQAGQSWDTSGTRPLFQQIGAAASSSPYINQLSGVGDKAGLPTSSGTNLGDMASGSYLKNGNPYFDAALKGQLDQTAAQTQSQFSGAGRYGSAADTGELTRNLGNIRSSALSDQFNRDSQNMLAANQQIDTANQGALGLQANAYSGAGNLYNTGINQAQNAATSMAGLDQNNFNNRLAGAGATMQAGQTLDQQAQQQLADQVAKFYSLDNEDWTRLGMLESGASGAAGPYGTQAAVSRTPVNVGSVIGGVGSLLGGKSDIRLKENLKPVGYRNGHVLWEFTYKGSPQKFRGVMAQMVSFTRPDAVIMEDDGYLAVDYGKLGFPMEMVI